MSRNEYANWWIWWGVFLPIWILNLGIMSGRGWDWGYPASVGGSFIAASIILGIILVSWLFRITYLSGRGRR